MHKALAIGVFAIGVPLAAQQQTVTCSSNGSAQTCPADTRNGVLLVREQSNNICRQGQTWSYDRRSINVSGGCSADFLVNTRRGGNGNSGNGGYGGNSYNDGGQYNGQSGSGSAYGTNGGQYDGNNGSQYNGNSNGGGGARVSLPQGTQIAFRMDQTVRVADLQQNDVVTGTLANDLSANGQTVASAGTPVQAKVQSVAGSPLDLRLDSMVVRGRTYVLQSNSVRGMRDAVSTPDAGSNRGGLGAVLGTLASAGSIPSGTVFNFRLTSAARTQ